MGHAKAPIDHSVSVVIPCYNAVSWIGAALESVFAQALPPLDVIVVDDGSTDGSATLVEDSFPAVLLLRSENRGPSAARNLGATRARGGWLQFLDADDLIHPEKLARQTSALATLADDVAFLFSPWQRLIASGGRWLAEGEILSPFLHPDPFVQTLDHFTHLSAGLVRRRWFEQVGGFDESRTHIEDVHLQLRLLLAGARFAFVPSPEPLFLHRQLPASLSRRDPERFIAGCYQNVRYAHTGLAAREVISPERRALLARAYAFPAAHYASTADPRFDEAITAIQRLVPGYVPHEPRRLAVTSRALGFRRALLLGVSFRRLKAWLGRAVRLVARRP